MNQNIRIELAVATIFLLLLKFWECSEIETVLVEVAVLVLIAKHLLVVIGGGDQKPPTIFFIVTNCEITNQEDIRPYITELSGSGIS